MEQHQCSPESNLCPECLLILALCKDCREDKEIFDEIFYSKFNDLFIDTENKRKQFQQGSKQSIIHSSVSPTGEEKSKFKELLHSKVRVKTIKKNIVQPHEEGNSEKKLKKRRQKTEKAKRKIEKIDIKDKCQHQKQIHKEKVLTKPESNDQNKLKLESSLLDALQFYQIDPDTCDQIFSNK